MTTRFASALVSLLLLGAAQSQPPTPRSAERKSPAPSEQPQSNQREPQILIGTESTPAVVRITESPEEASRKQADRERQATTNGRLIGLTAAIALFTLGLIYVGWKQRQTYEATLATNKVIERAYVTLSHEPPGVFFSELQVESRNSTPMVNVGINLTVRNFGNTPANVTGSLFHFIVGDEPLADTPVYNHALAKVTRVSLVKDDHFNFFINTPMSADSIVQIRTGVLKLHAVGYVDYIDKFGQRHRSSYARVYDPGLDDQTRYTKPDTAHSASLVLAGLRVLDGAAFDRRSNLPFVTQPGYNRDRKRKKGEGNDWDEPQQ